MNEFPHLPEGYHSVTPSITVRDAHTALKFYADAFGAVEKFRMPDSTDESKLMHAEFCIGDSTIMISDEYPTMGAVAPEMGQGAAFMIYVADAVAVFDTAIAAGATEIAPVEDMFWGDRMGRVADPYGYRWSIAQKIKEVSPEEVEEGAKQWTEDRPK